MKKALIELWEKIQADSRELSEEERKLLGYLERHYTEMVAKLDEQGNESLKKYESCYNELIVMAREEAFVQGFSWATKLLAESFT